MVEGGGGCGQAWLRAWKGMAVLSTAKAHQNFPHHRNLNKREKNNNIDDKTKQTETKT
jgi:hypothetical protein